MKRPLAFTLLALVLVAAGRAAEVSDLGQGLAYLRAHVLGEALQPLRGGTPLVLDLRHVTTERELVGAFAESLQRRPRTARLYLLVGPDTPPEIAGVLTTGSENVLTLGIAGSRPAPTVVVAQSAEEDRQAFDAVEHGAPLADLVSGKVAKDHFDEAALVREFKQGNHDAHPEPGNPDAGAKAPPHPTDRVLQRAVHLHHALLALRR